MNRSLYLVAGLGKTGLSIARYLHRKQKSFIVFDTRDNAPGLAEFRAEFPHTPLFLKHFPELADVQIGNRNNGQIEIYANGFALKQYHNHLLKF